MLTATVETILAATGGTLVFGSPDVVGNDVAVDSREVVAGCVFFALRGERVDGHDFLKQAISAGARVLIVSRGDDELSGVCTMPSAERSPRFGWTTAPRRFRTWPRFTAHVSPVPS